MTSRSEDLPSNDERIRIARTGVYRWRTCRACGRFFEGDSWLHFGPASVSRCLCGDSDSDKWPGISAELLIQSLAQDWDDEPGHLLGVVLLAAGAEVVFEEFLYDLLVDVSRDANFAQVILRQTGSVRQRLELVNSIIVGGIKNYWIDSGLTKLYDEWDNLQDDRNTVSHGRVWFRDLKFKACPLEFAQQFLKGLALLHNAQIEKRIATSEQ